MPENPYAKFKPLAAPKKPDDPYKISQERRAEEDHSFQRVKFETEQANQNAPKLPNGYMWKDGVVGGEAVLIKGVAAPKNGAGSLDPKTTEGQKNIAGTVLTAAGVSGNKDPVADLIKNSTSGYLQTLGAGLYGDATGEATSGMEAIGRLKTISNDMVLQMSGGSLGAQISDGDRKFIADRMGNIGDETIPYNQRLAAWDQVKKRLQTMSGVDGSEAQDLSISIDPAMLNEQGQPKGYGPEDYTQNGYVSDELRSKQATPLIDAKNGISVIPDDGGTTTGFSADKYVSDELKAKNDELNRLWLGGDIRTIADLYAAAERLGIDISKTDKNNLKLQIKRGERGAFAPQPDKERTGVQKAAGDFIDSPAGAYGVGSLNALTLGGLDEAVGFFAGEEAGQRTQDVKEYLTENRPGAYFAGNVGGSVLGIGALPEALAAKVATKGGATATGAIAGALESNDNRVLGALTGGVVGRYAPQAVNALANKAAPVVSSVKNALTPLMERTKGIIPGFGGRNALADEVRGNAGLIRAGVEEDVPIRLPNVAPSQRGKYQELKSSDGGGDIIAKTEANDVAALESAVQRVGGGGTAQERFNAGQGIQSTVLDQKDKIRTEASALYRRAEAQAPGFKADAGAVSSNIDQKIASIKAVTPEGNESHIGLLEKIKGNFEKTGLSTETLQANREIVRSHVKDSNLAFTPKEVELLDAISVAGDEYEKALMASGNRAAAQTLKTANEKWREYSDFKKQVVQVFNGTEKQPVSPERAAERLMAMVKPGGDSGKFAKVFRAMDDSGKADFRALVAENLGKGANGEFTPTMLARNLSQKQANYQTLREVFGPDGFKSLMNLKAIAVAQRDTMNAPIGTSTRREVGGAKRLILGFFGMSGGIATGGTTGAVVGGMAIPAIAKMGERRAARLLLNKDVTQFIRELPETTNPQVINRMFNKLEKTAPVNSVAASDILSLKQALMETFSTSPGKIAAAENEDN